MYCIGNLKLTITSNTKSQSNESNAFLRSIFIAHFGDNVVLPYPLTIFCARSMLSVILPPNECTLIPFNNKKKEPFQSINHYLSNAFIHYCTTRNWSIVILLGLLHLGTNATMVELNAGGRSVVWKKYLTASIISLPTVLYASLKKCAV